MNKLLLILFSFSFSSSAVAVLKENDDEHGLKRTVIKDLRVSQNLPPYQSDEFPFQESDLIGMSHTNFCPNLPEITRTHKLLASPYTQDSLNVAFCEDGRCVVIKPESFPLGKEAILKKVIPGKDGRVRVINTSELPYRFYGHMIMEFSNGKEYVGSGMLVGPHHILTAGHNIFSHKIGEGWATSVKFIPARNEAEMPFGGAQGVVLLSVNNWVENQNKDYDFGMVILDKPIGYQTGWAGMLSIFHDLLKQSTIHVSGYPGDKGEKDLQSTQMWTMSHRVKVVLRDQITYGIEPYPGQSGSGVWTQLPGYKGYYIVGVHGYRGEDQSNENAVTRISAVKLKRLVSWMREYQLQDFYHPELPSEEEKTEKATYVTYKDEAKGGNAESQYQLALCYKEGRGVQKNPDKAFEWYNKAAAQGHKIARRELALCYEKGIGIEKNVIFALGILLKLENDAWAQTNIGILYDKGHGVAQDYVEAMRWYQLAATQNHPAAQAKIGELYHNGLGVPSDYGEARRWYQFDLATIC